ncbi:MAG: DUF2783 domain-containing protein [Spiribacter salinus]|uniref:DUF2783 domain-containing protein n=1 Tax=Spiribacter salinus TaxID=1335746 RepID=A0A540VQU6_9GAMM|nr:MAG: DUF2783 domain-containing protein [Spiribacter salinus]
MSELELESNFNDPDGFYAALAEIHRNRDETTSQRINARLILILANEIGDQKVLEEALHIAADTGDEDTR